MVAEADAKMAVIQAMSKMAAMRALAMVAAMPALALAEADAKMAVIQAMSKMAAMRALTMVAAMSALAWAACLLREAKAAEPRKAELPAAAAGSPWRSRSGWHQLKMALELVRLRRRALWYAPLRCAIEWTSTPSCPRRTPRCKLRAQIEPSPRWLCARAQQLSRRHHRPAHRR